MKKLTTTIVSLIVLSLAALPVAAQTRGRCVNRSSNNDQVGRRYERRNVGTREGRIRPTAAYQNEVYSDAVYADNGYSDDAYNNDVYGQDRSLWEKHRDKITTAGGAVGGAVVGGLLGGKKGAVIGAIAGGAGAAVYTYKVRDRIQRY
jgi:hypothetical protein